jgi:hypothetical protein
MRGVKHDNGARSRNRTGTTVKSQDFKSIDSFFEVLCENLIIPYFSVL